MRLLLHLTKKVSLGFRVLPKVGGDSKLGTCSALRNVAKQPVTACRLWPRVAS